VVEGTNLYFTNARVYSAVTGNLALKANVTDLTTSNVAEGTNLYFTNARVYSAVTGNLALKANVADLTTSNVAEGTNLYFTNARSYANTLVALKSGNGISYSNTTGNITLSPTGVTASTYGNSTIIPVITVDTFGRITNISNIASAATGGGGGGNVASVNGLTGTIVLTTTEISEGANLYYTNARSYANTLVALKSGNGILYSNTTGNITLSATGVSPVTYGNASIIPIITVDAFGRITSVSNVNVQTTNTVEVKRYVYNGTVGQTVFSGTDVNGRTLSLSDSSNAFVYLNGILLTNTIDYTAYTSNVTFTESLAAAGNVTVVENLFSSTTPSAIGSNVIYLTDSFSGDGNTTSFTMSTNANQSDSLVILDGLVQFYTLDYSINNGNQLLFTSAPETGETIKVLHLQNTGGQTSEDWGLVDGLSTSSDDYGSIV